MADLLSHEIAGTRVGHMPTHELVDMWTAASSRCRQARLRDRVSRSRAAAHRHLRRTAHRHRPRRRLRNAVLPAVAPVRTLGAVGGAVDRAQAGRAAAHARQDAVHDRYCRPTRWRPPNSPCSCCTNVASPTRIAGSRDFVHTDWRYVQRYYELDRLPPWEECVVTEGPLITPQPIPPLKHRQVEVRFAF